MTSRRPKPEVFTAPKGAVIITLTNDGAWARDVLDQMDHYDTVRLADSLDVDADPSQHLGAEFDDDLWEVLQEDAFDGGHTEQGHYFFVVTVETDHSADDVFVCSSLPLAHTVKDELLEGLK